MTSSDRISVWIALGVFVVGFGSGCDRATSGGLNSTVNKTGTSGRPAIKIVTTTGMVTDIVKHVAGQHADVSGLIEAGGDPHLFKPTRGHIKQLHDADVVFYSGLMLEGRMSETFTQLQRSGKAVFAVTESLSKDYLRSPPDFAGHYDPHVWMDVKAWSQCVGHVAESLATFDAAHADEYRANARSYQSELAKLDDYVRTAIQSIPESQRVLVTAHDAFGYFSRAYNIEVKSVQGVTTEAEAGVLDVNRLVDFLVERRLPAIFVESSVNGKNIQAVIEGAKSRGVTVQVGGELFSDAMGAAGTYEGTYVGMLDHNATLIARALGGTAPAKGINGKLSAAANSTLGITQTQTRAFAASGLVATGAMACFQWIRERKSRSYRAAPVLKHPARLTSERGGISLRASQYFNLGATVTPSSGWPCDGSWRFPSRTAMSRTP